MVCSPPCASAEAATHTALVAANHLCEDISTTQLQEFACRKGPLWYLTCIPHAQRGTCRTL